MDPEVPTANGQVPHDEACRSLRTSTVFGRLPTAGTSNWRDSRRSLSSELETKAVTNFCFQNLGAKNVHLVAMMRLVLGFQAQSCDCTKFSGRKTSRSSRKMRLCARIFRALLIDLLIIVHVDRRR